VGELRCGECMGELRCGECMGGLRCGECMGGLRCGVSRLLSRHAPQQFWIVDRFRCIKPLNAFSRHLFHNFNVSVRVKKSIETISKPASRTVLIPVRPQ
jgi:hypothetical protein